MNDKEIRRAVLEAMNTQRKNSRHEHEIRMHVSQIERGVRKAGLKVSEKQVMEAVDYLKETGMLKRTQETKTVKMASYGRSSRLSSGNTSFKHTNYWYKLTAKAIDSLEGETEYSSKPFVPLQNIQITTSNAPVIFGSNNQVNNNVTIFNQLDELEQVISESTDISVEDRQDVVSDIESLKQQLAKPNPNKTIIELLWQNIGRAADLAGAATLAVTIAKGIATLIGHPLG